MSYCEVKLLNTQPGQVKNKQSLTSAKKLQQLDKVFLHKRTYDSRQIKGKAVVLHPGGLEQRLKSINNINKCQKYSWVQCNNGADNLNTEKSPHF